MTIAASLDAALRTAGVPIVGVSIGRIDDKTTWRIDFATEATDAQKGLAPAVLAAFNAAAAAAAAEKAQILAASDRDLPRVFEDLIDALVAKKVISLSDLPQAARDKLAARKTLRNG